MTEQEQQLISGLAERIRNAPPPQVDRDADELIRRTIGARPDSLYILTQTVLIQEMALNQAKAQLEQLRQQGAPQQQGSFLQPGSYPELIRRKRDIRIRAMRRRPRLHRVAVVFRVSCITRPLPRRE